MRTLRAGVTSIRRTPLALLPLGLEAVAGAWLIGLGVFPTGAASAASTAAFPSDVFFDVKQTIAYASSWVWVVLALALSVVVRGTVLAATLYLSDGPRRGASLPRYLLVAGRLAAVAAAASIPSAALYYAGVALRYAPLIAVAAALGVPVAAALAVRAANALVEGVGSRAPGLWGYLGYGYVVCLLGAALSALAAIGAWLAALLVVIVAPLHAAALLGWREHARHGTEALPSTTVAVITLAAIVGLGGMAVSRRFATTPPVAEVHPHRTLLLLGGWDSTSRSGDLFQLHLSELGFDRRHARVLSYRGPGKRYHRRDTHGPLGPVARRVARQIARVKRPVVLADGQGGWIVDRILERGLHAPRRAATMASLPDTRPPLSAPRPGHHGPGEAGADLTRIVEWVMSEAGLAHLDIDAPAAPVHLRPVEPPTGPPARLVIFSVDDAAWLTGDWRRPGATNLVSLADHSGVPADPYAVHAAGSFLRGHRVASDASSWRSVLVEVIAYAFAPWRPG